MVERDHIVEIAEVEDGISIKNVFFPFFSIFKIFYILVIHGTRFRIFSGTLFQDSLVSISKAQ